MKKYIILFPENKSYKIYYFTTLLSYKYILQTNYCYKLNLHKLFQGYKNYKKYTKKLKNPKNLYLRQITGKF